MGLYIAEVSCLSAILTYTKYMGGVDLGDQFRKYYAVRLKCIKNFKYFFWFIFDASITNAFILSKLCNHPRTSHDEGRLKAFRVSLAENLNETSQPHPCTAANVSPHSFSLTPPSCQAAMHVLPVLSRPALQKGECVAVRTVRGQSHTLPHRQR